MHLPNLFKSKMEQTIEIKCAGHTTVQLSELHDLQGNFKDLTEDNYVKLRNSMVEFGFSFPIFYWQDEQGTKYIVDAHQRVRTLTKMQEEGWTIPPLPADPIYADSKIQAKEKLLLLNSQYGKITQEGWDEFTADLPMTDIEDLLEIPGLYEPGEETNTTASSSTDTEEKKVTCPNCQTVFSPQ